MAAFSYSTIGDTAAGFHGVISAHISNAYGADNAATPSEKLVVPERARKLLGVDYFTDFITPRSPLNGTTSPLAAVAQQGIGRLDLDLILKGNAPHRLVRFAMRTEAGYSSNFYHSKMHAADVSNRMVSLLTKSGIADAACGECRVMMMAAMVAAMLHDFEHPQVTNHFLVDQVISYALARAYESVLKEGFRRLVSALVLCPTRDMLVTDQSSAEKTSHCNTNGTLIIFCLVCLIGRAGRIGLQ